MNKSPYIPFYPDSYLADTILLSLEDQGAYVRLWSLMWLHGGSLADDDSLIAKLLGIHVNKWRKIQSNLLAHLVYDSECNLSIKGLQDCYEASERKRRVNSKNAKGRWAAKSAENGESDDKST